MREGAHRYAISPKGREADWQNKRTPKAREAQRRQRQSPRRREYNWQYRNVNEKGREIHRRNPTRWGEQNRGHINALARKRWLERVQAEYNANPTQHNYNRIMRCRG